MRTSTTYDREIKKAYVYQDNYQVASYDFNSNKFEAEIEMTKEKADEYFELMEQAKVDDKYFVLMED